MKKMKAICKFKSIANSIIFFFLILPLSNALSATELKFTTQEFAPFSYHINGVPSGPVVDVIRLVCNEMNVECSFMIYPWTRAQKMVEKGKANGMFVIGWNPERAEWLYFSEPLLITEYGFFTNDEHLFTYDDVEKIRGLRIAVYGPSNTSRALEKIRSDLGGDLIIDMRHDNESGFKKLSAGRVDAVFSNRDVGYALIKKTAFQNIRYAGPHKKLKYYIGFSKKHNDNIVVERFNQIYRNLFSQGKIQKVFESYSLEVAGIE